MLYLAYALTSVFLSIALVHIYWAFGGRWGRYAALPQRPDGTYLFVPRFIDSMAVALGLLCFGYVCLAHVRLVPIFGLERFTRWAIFAIAAIFLLRFIGERRYVGIMRKITATEFARRDRVFYTTLCFALAAGVFILGML